MSATNDFQSSVVTDPECGQRKGKGVFKNNLFVKDLPQDIGTPELVELFSRFGPIVSAKVEVSVLGNSKCHGYVSFEETSDAKTARK
jgi:RNA recognition motif-containing protein